MGRVPRQPTSDVLGPAADARRGRRRLALAALALVAALALEVTSGRAASVTVPRLVAVRAAQHGGFDRVVFEFRGGIPRQRRAGYVPALTQDASGLRIAMPARAILRVSMASAVAHDQQGRATAPLAVTPALRNVVSIKLSGGFEAVVSYGIGLAARRPFRVTALRDPDRVVLEIDNRYRAAKREVWFMNLPRFRTGREPLVSAVTRWVPAATPATGVLDRLFAGPTAAESAHGLRLVTSDATGFDHLALTGGQARVRLTGGCASHGSTLTIANEIVPTLRQFAGVTAVKILDPHGATEKPSGVGSSIPTCLEP